MMMGAHLNTHYYSGIKKFQCVACCPMHSVVVRRDGSGEEIRVGDREAAVP